ncbi:hypothetical protein C9J49_007305 [Halomonas sp. SL1]|nr:hypothetical protein C9J49_007305 [Halomonas sp. SL1]
MAALIGALIVSIGTGQLSCYEGRHLMTLNARTLVGHFDAQETDKLVIKTLLRFNVQQLVCIYRFLTV